MSPKEQAQVRAGMAAKKRKDERREAGRSPITGKHVALLIALVLFMIAIVAGTSGTVFRQCEADYENIYIDKGTARDIGLDQYCRNTGGNQ